MLSANQNTFLSLVRMGIGHSSAQPDVDNWQAIKALADKQGLTAIVADGIEKLPDTKRPSKELLLQWIGEIFQSYENRYNLYHRAIAELAGWYNAHGYKMMVLKGYACSIDWPKPEHRPCGDIDIWLFGKQKEADKELFSSFRIQDPSFKIDSSHHHQTVFDWCGFSVENHYDFVNVHAHKSSAKLETVFKELGKDDSHSVEVLGEKVYLPSPNLHALFLIRHMLSHFAAAEITLRQVLDWAFFVEKHTKNVDWKWLDEMIVKFHMKEFVSCINAISVEDLGFSVDIFPEVQFVPSLKKRVLEDIFDPEYTATSPNGLCKRLIYKFRRWQGNAWKQEMCYSESRWSAFWSGILAKVLKPASL